MPQEDRISALPSDIHGMIWAYLVNPEDKLALYKALPAVRTEAVHAQIQRLEISAGGASHFLLRRQMFERLSRFPPACVLRELSLIKGSHAEDLVAFLKQACIKKNDLMRGVKRIRLGGWDMNAKLGCDCGLCSHGQPDLNFEVVSALYSTCPELEELILDKCEIGEDMFCTPLFHKLRRLEISEMGDLDTNNINPVESIARLTQLQELRLCWDETESIADISPLTHCKMLTRLTVGGGFIELQGLEEVLSSCQKLCYLDFTFEDCSFFLGPPDKDELFMREKTTLCSYTGVDQSPPGLILSAFQVTPAHLCAILKLPAIRPGNCSLGCVCLALATEEEVEMSLVARQAEDIQEAAALVLPLLPQGEAADALAHERLQSNGLSSPVLCVDRVSDALVSFLPSPRTWMISLAPLQPCLRGLSLYALEMGPEDVRVLADTLPSLWAIELSGSRFLPGAVHAMVLRLPQLRKLSLIGGRARVSDVVQACTTAQASQQPWTLQLHLRHMLEDDSKAHWDGILVEKCVNPEGRVDLVQLPKPERPLRRSARLRAKK